MITVSYSEVVAHQTCDRQHYYRHILGLTPIEASDPIATGSKGHKLLQTFYGLLREGKPKDEALIITRNQANRWAHDSNTIDFNLLKAWTLVDNYIRETDFESEVLLVENRFLLPASKLIGYVEGLDLDQVQIGFTPDLVRQRTGGYIDVEDSKFVQRAWSESKLDRFSQIKLYQIFLERMGYKVSRCVLRFFNTTTGKISIQPYTLEKAEEQILIKDFMKGVRDVVNSKNENPYDQALATRTMNATACQFCQFSYPCTLEARGKSATKTLNSQYVKSDYDYTR